MLKNASEYYKKNEQKVDLSFFVGGFIFDIFTLSQIDDPLSILQQIVYLGIIGGILYLDFLAQFQKFTPTRFLKLWEYRTAILHFFLGSLLSVYSLFFLKSSSIFSSIVFVLLLLGLMILNEFKSVHKSQINLKVGLFSICVFSFYSLLIPVVMGFVGWFSFLASILLTAGTFVLVFEGLKKKINDTEIIVRSVMAPSLGILVLFVLFYFMGWIPPVPISINGMGVYHRIEVVEGKYQLQYDRPSYKFWQSGAQSFRAEPGDPVVFFVQIFSPARFDDQVILNWLMYDQKQGWVSSDRIPIRIQGGRKNGFRGYTIKKNYSPGEWQVKVQTTDGREIGRLYFEVEKNQTALAERNWKTDIY